MLRRFFLFGIMIIALIMLTQYFSIKWSKKVAQSIVESETSGGSIEIKEE